MKSAIPHVQNTDLFQSKTDKTIKFHWDEIENSYLLRGEILVELDPKKITISLSSHQLTIETNYSPSLESISDEPMTLWMRKTFPIPRNGNEEHITAKIQDNYLVIFIPKMSMEKLHPLQKSVEIIDTNL